MAEQPPIVGDLEPAERESPPGVPRWVKVAGIVVGLLILLFVVLQLTGVAGQHGPGRHMSGSAGLPAAAVDGPLPVAAVE